VAGNDPWELIGIEEWRQLRTRTEWADALNRPLPEPGLRTLRLATRSGAPYGSEEFVRSLEQKTGRRLELRGRGRPRRREMAVSAKKSVEKRLRRPLAQRAEISARSVVNREHVNLLVADDSVGDPIGSVNNLAYRRVYVLWDYPARSRKVLEPIHDMEEPAHDDIGVMRRVHLNERPNSREIGLRALGPGNCCHARKRFLTSS